MIKKSDNSLRSGLLDMWNAYMVENAIFSENDIPLCNTTATSIPKELIGYDVAKQIHKTQLASGNKDYHINAFIHFFIDEQNFDGPRSSIWLYPEKALEIISHFDGIIAPDFSTFLDFPEPLFRWNLYRMNAFGHWISTYGIAVISNGRWGYEYSWDYCFDGNPKNNMIAIGTVASGLKLLSNRPVFKAGLNELVNRLHPTCLIIYGSSKYECIEEIKNRGIEIVSFPSKTSQAYSERRKHHV